MTARKSWLDRDAEAALAVVAESFDIAEEQEARAVWPYAVKKFYFKDEALYLRAEFSVDYANPVDDVDGELSTVNVAENVVDLRMEAPDLAAGNCGEVSWADQAFPC